jgi:hypothetical protein
MAETCLKCGAPLPKRAAGDVGRSRDYCDAVCRRAVEYELRRLQRRLQGLEDTLAHVVASGAGDQAQGRHLRKAIATAEGRLRVLLAGSPDTD